MYNKNELMRDTLITWQEVVFHAPTKHTLDERMIAQSIVVAEERFIRPEIGSEMYDYICSNKNVVVTPVNLAALQTAIGSGITLAVGDVVNAFEQLNPSYQELWKKHLWKITAECVMISAYPEGFTQFSTQGAMHEIPPAGLQVTSGFVLPTLSTIKWTLDKKIQDRVSPLILSMHEFICKNMEVSGFSLYGKECADCKVEQEQKAVKNAGIALDLYDDGETTNCCF